VRWRQIAGIAGSLGARLMVLSVPTPGEVCAPADLAYWPRGVDLADTTRFDASRPQRWTAELATAVGAEYHDLHEVLRGGACPYQPRNMHWTADGHRRVADAVAAWLAPAEGTT
jgi:lysophospholipase L1-like esterase